MRLLMTKMQVYMVINTKAATARWWTLQRRLRSGRLGPVRYVLPIMRRDRLRRVLVILLTYLAVAIPRMPRHSAPYRRACLSKALLARLTG